MSSAQIRRMDSSEAGFAEALTTLLAYDVGTSDEVNLAVAQVCVWTVMLRF
jgi:hypothetical protein